MILFVVPQQVVRVNTILESCHPTSGSHVERDAYVDVQVLGLDCEEDGATEREGLRELGVVVALHLSGRVEAVVAIDTHLAVAVVAAGRRSVEVLHALRALRTEH